MRRGSGTVIGQLPGWGRPARRCKACKRKDRAAGLRVPPLYPLSPIPVPPVRYPSFLVACPMPHVPCPPSPESVLDVAAPRPLSVSRACILFHDVSLISDRRWVGAHGLYNLSPCVSLARAWQLFFRLVLRGGLVRPVGVSFRLAKNFLENVLLYCSRVADEEVR